jgi:hypothetical protein
LVVKVEESAEEKLETAAVYEYLYPTSPIISGVN